jgi:NitT/TauT family transport system substrate-binding protein
MRLWSTLVALAAFSAATGTSVAQEMKTLNFMSSNETSCSPYPQHVADVFGFWSERGLKVNFLSSDTTVPYVAFLQNGQADVAMMDSAQILQAVDNELPIKVIYVQQAQSTEGILVAADSPIKSLSGMKDVTIGLTSDRDLLTATIALESVGTTLEKNNIKTVVVGEEVPIIAKALQDKTIAALAGTSNEIAGLLAAGVTVRNLTPIEVQKNPSNSMVVWGPTIDEKRPMLEAFVRGWAMGQQAGIVDTKLTASACRMKIPEQFENLEIGLNLITTSAFTRHIRRTKDYGELEPDVWARIQGPLVSVGEIKKEHNPSDFLDFSFFIAANDWTTDGLKAAMNAWKTANPDKLIP